MAKIILKSPYLKAGAKTHASSLVRHIASRRQAEMPNDSKRNLSATDFQNKTVAELLRDYPDAAELHEYADYRTNPTRANADEFILRVAETHPELLGGRERYVDYIATRPGVVHIAENGLFSDSGDPMVLEHIVDEVAGHTGNIWCHIISLRREDAARLGYESVEAWQELLRSQRNVIARNMKIHPNNFRWYAAFHNKEHHPHVHVVAYSSKPSEPHLTVKGIENIKSSLAKQIFRSDMEQVHQRQNEYRDTLRQDGGELAAEIVRQINTGDYDNPAVEELLLKLADRLNSTSGKKVYGYLKPDVKSIVDRVVDELAKDGRISKLYDLWYEQKFDTIRTYTDRMPEKLPLSQNEDFKPIRNAVISEAQNILLDRLTFEEAVEDAWMDPLPDGEPASNELDDPHPDDTSDYETENKFVLYRRAKLLLDDASPEYDPQEAIRLLIGSAQQNYEWAQYRLGKIFLLGDPVERDVEYGLKWLWEAEAQNNQYAQIILGRTYLKGEMVPQDIGMAESMFEFASDQGNADAQYALAKLHLNGQVENPSVTKALELLEASANGGNEWAQYTLGKLLMRGEITPKDAFHAEQLLLAAAKPRPSRDGSGRINPGNQYAEYLLGKLYLSEDGIPKDAAKAVYYLNDSAEQGNQWAQYQLGKMLLYGKEVEQNTLRGLELLTEASRQGNIYADRVIENYYKYRDRSRSNIKIGAALGSLRLLGHLARIIKNRLDEENRRDGNSGIIESKLRRQIEEKRQSHGQRMG